MIRDSFRKPIHASYSVMMKAQVDGEVWRRQELAEEYGDKKKPYLWGGKAEMATISHDDILPDAEQKDAFKPYLPKEEAGMVRKLSGQRTKEPATSISGQVKASVSTFEIYAHIGRTTSSSTWTVPGGKIVFNYGWSIKMYWFQTGDFKITAIDGDGHKAVLDVEVT